jgi:hypothetical protein
MEEKRIIGYHAILRYTKLVKLRRVKATNTLTGKQVILGCPVMSRRHFRLPSLVLKLPAVHMTFSVIIYRHWFGSSGDTMMRVPLCSKLGTVCVLLSVSRTVHFVIHFLALVNFGKGR